MWAFSTTIFLLAVGLASSSYSSSQSISSSPTSKSPSVSVTPSSKSPVTSSSSSISPSPTSPSPSASASPTPKPSTPRPTSKPRTTSKPTLKPTATPPPKPLGGDYSVKDKSGYCLLANLDVMFTVKYERMVHNKTVMTSAVVHIPFNKTVFSTVGSQCGHAPELKISWPVSSHLYNFTMVFTSLKKGDTNDTEWRVSQMTLNANLKDNPDFVHPVENRTTVSVTNATELAGLSATSKGYYLCAANRTYDSTNGQVLFKYIKLQPFGVKPSNSTEQFGKEFNCAVTPTPKPNNDGNNIVPIAVGCALAGLVLIVLIAYIIGRRKSQRGYEKV